MVDITTIPLEELHADRLACIEDITLCSKAAALGIKTYCEGASVQERLYTNAAIVDQINEELARRKEKQE